MSNSRPTGSSAVAWWAWHISTFATISYVALANISVADYSPDEWVYSSCGYQLVTSSKFCNAGHPPLTKIWFGVWEYLFGDTIRVARVAAGLVAIATAVLIYLLVRRVLDWRWGLVGAALWGLTPQAGGTGNVTDLVVRISRYALLEPLLCFFVVLAIYAGWRWRQEERSRWAALTAFAAVAAALSKELGIVAAPVLVAVPAAACWWGHRSRVKRDVGALAGGALSAVIATFAVFGPIGGATNVLSFLRALPKGGGVVAHSVLNGRLVDPAPWWLGLRYMQLGMSTALIVVVVVGVAFGLHSARTRFLVVYCLSVSTVMIVALIVSRREIDFYWIAWEPPLLIAATVGLGDAVLDRWRRWAVWPALAVVTVLMVLTVIDVATLSPGPYHRAAHEVRCTSPCVVLSLGRQFLPNLYGLNSVVGVSGGTQSIIRGAGSRVVIPMGTLTSTQRLARYVFVDTSAVSYLLVKSRMPAALTRMGQLGYRRLATYETLSVYELEPATRPSR